MLKYSPSIKTKEVKLELYNMSFTPWKGIGFRNEDGENKSNCPKWWNGYNSVKHRRITFGKENNIDEVRYLIDNLVEIIQKLRK